MWNFPDQVVKAPGLLQGEIWYVPLWTEQDVPNDGKTA